MVEGTENDSIKFFGRKLAEIRKSKKLTLEMLANMADIDLSGLHRIEIGKNNPKLSTIVTLAKVLGISPKDFFDE